MHQIPQPKDQARLLKDFFAARGMKVPHQDMLEAVAIVMGFRNWKTMASADYARAALLSKDEEMLLTERTPGPFLAIQDQMAFYNIQWPGEPGYGEELDFARWKLAEHGYTPCSQWFEEEAEDAGRIPEKFDVSAIQARIDSGAMAFSLVNEHHTDVSAYRFRKSKGWVELVNIGYSEELHEAGAPRHEGRFWYSAWRYDRKGNLLQDIHADRLYSLTHALLHLMNSNDFGARVRIKR